MKEIKLLESLTGKKVILKENSYYMGTAGEKFVISGGSGGNRPPLWQIFKAESPFTRVDMMFDDRSDAEDFATKRGFVLVDGFIEDELKEDASNVAQVKTSPIKTFTFGFDLEHIS
jgi:hypothetical protein